MVCLRRSVICWYWPIYHIWTASIGIRTKGPERKNNFELVSKQTQAFVESSCSAFLFNSWLVFSCHTSYAGHFYRQDGKVTLNSWQWWQYLQVIFCFPCCCVLSIAQVGGLEDGRQACLQNCQISPYKSQIPPYKRSSTNTNVIGPLSDALTWWYRKM